MSQYVRILSANDVCLFMIIKEQLQLAPSPHTSLYLVITNVNTTLAVLPIPYIRKTDVIATMKHNVCK